MRPEKEAIVRELRAKIDGSGFVILADYQGLTVSATDELRDKLHGVNARLQVVPNRLFRQAVKETQVDGLGDDLTGPSALVTGEGDVVQTAKILRDFARLNKKPSLSRGALGSKALNASDLEALADLPSREELLAKVVGTIAAPLSQTVGVLSQKVASIVYVLKSIQDKKQAA